MQIVDRHGPRGGRKLARRLGLPALAALPIVVALGLVAVLGASAKGTQGNPAAGKTVFKANCAACHTLKAAGATATIGPNLDKVSLSQAQIEDQVTHGGTTIMGPAAAKKYPTPMPAFKGILSTSQIQNVAAFVYQAQHPGAKTPVAAPTTKKPGAKKIGPKPTKAVAPEKKKAAPAPATKPSTKKKAAAAPTPTTKKAAPAPKPAPPKTGKAPGFTG